MKFCNYGCGKEAKYQLKNGKWCCSSSWRKCPKVTEKKSRSMRNAWKKIDNKLNSEKTNVARRRSMSGKNTGSQTSEHIEKAAATRRGKSTWNKGLTKETDERVRKISEKYTGKTYEEIMGVEKAKEQKELKKRQMTIDRSKFMNSIPRNPDKMKKLKEDRSNWMKNGGAVYLDSFPRNLDKIRKFKEDRKQWMKLNGNRLRKLIKRTSKDEIKLRGMTKELYPASEHTYKVLENKNYDVDNALVEHKIAIEFDGYYHFDTEEHREYHKKRQQEIVEGGWKFLRYTIFDKFPTKEQLKNDILRVIEENPQ